MRRRVAIAAAATASSGRTFASGSSGSISRNARRIGSTIDADATSDLAIRNIGCGYHICGCGKYKAGAARLSQGISRTSPTTPAIVRSAPQRFRRAPTAASGVFQYFVAAASFTSTTSGAPGPSDWRQLPSGHQWSTGRSRVAVGDEVIPRLGSLAIRKPPTDDREAGVLVIACPREIGTECTFSNTWQRSNTLGRAPIEVCGAIRVIPCRRELDRRSECALGLKSRIRVDH